MAVFYDVTSLNLTTTDNTDYSAILKLGSSGLDQLVKRVLSNGTEYTEQAVRAIIGLSERAQRELVCEGNIVTTENFILQPTITGTFTAKGLYDSDVNNFTVSATPTKTFKAALAEVTPKFSGTVVVSGGARIAIVTDSYTGKTDGTITPGQIITVTGTKIKCVNADGSGLGSIAFLNAETLATAAEVETLSTNDPSKLVFICPSLADGSYILRITTYYTRGSSLLKTARTIDSDTLTVGTVASTTEEETSEEESDETTDETEST